MAAYTDSAKIAAYLGVTLTGAQETQAGVLADAATAWIDRFTGQSWQDDGSVTDELHQVQGGRIYLAHRPVTAISSLAVRQEIVSGDWDTLDSSEYEILDAANGVVLVSGWGQYLTKTSYTHSMTTAPADVQLAASMIAASWLSQALRPNTSGLDSLAVGQNDIALKFSASRADVPMEARSILRAYRRVVIA